MQQNCKKGLCLAFLFSAMFLTGWEIAGMRSRQTKETAAVAYEAGNWGLGFGAVVGVVLALTAPWMSRIFTTDLTVIDYATTAIIFSAFFQPVAGYVFLLDGILIGAGHGRYLAAVSLLNLAVYAPVLWLIAHSSALASSPALALALVWLAYSAVYTGMRAFTNGYAARTL